MFNPTGQKTLLRQLTLVLHGWSKGSFGIHVWVVGHGPLMPLAGLCVCCTSEREDYELPFNQP